MNEEQQNTMLAFADWMDENVDGYIITYTNNGVTGMVLKGDEDELVDSLSTGMVKHPELKRIILKAVGLACGFLNQQSRLS